MLAAETLATRSHWSSATAVGSSASTWCWPGLPKGGAFNAAALKAGRIALIQGDVQALPVADGA
jgi:hypothetical protein